MNCIPTKKLLYESNSFKNQSKIHNRNYYTKPKIQLMMWALNSKQQQQQQQQTDGSECAASACLCHWTEQYQTLHKDQVTQDYSCFHWVYYAERVSTALQPRPAPRVCSLCLYIHPALASLKLACELHRKDAAHTRTHTHRT